MPSNFDFFLNLITILPVLLLLRFIWPNAAFFRACCAFFGAYLLYFVSPRFVAFIAFFWVVIWALQYVVRLAMDRNWSILFAGVIVAVLSPMLLWKIFPIPFQNAANEYGNALLHFALPFASLTNTLYETAVPVGMSFFTFRAIDLLVKIFLGVLDPLSFGRVLFYGLFPPILSLGPIAEYEEVRQEKVRRTPIPGDIAVGVFRIALGAAKIFLLAVALQVVAERLWAGGEGAIWAKWLATLAYGMFFYLNFSGYSEVAIGAARVLGIKLKENFANPYMKTNPQAFWNSWHMSLTRFAQRYVFVPLGGMRKSGQYPAIFLTMMVIALWHGLTLPILLFGILHSSVIMGYRWLGDRAAAAGVQPSEDGVAIAWLKRFALFAFISVTIPMLLLEAPDAARFYRALIGL